MNPNRGTALALVILAAIAAAAVQVERGPSPLPSTADENRFSGARAIATLHEIIPDNTPHPVGTPAHDAVRDRVAARFRALGYDTSMQQSLGCNAHATCAPVVNIMARLPGDARAETLAVVAHYDSVAAGPGATDDGVGAATVLEVARAVRQQHFRNSILFLITDAEEQGLLGAEAFVANPQLSRGVTAAINLDNRGTAGRSFMFETSAQNEWLVRSMASALPHPATSSLFYAMYQLLPNDTDLSVFKRAGIAGLNFACVRGVTHYHTPLDNLQHVTPTTVQDHGDHMLAMTRALANTDLRQTSDDDATFVDVFSIGIFWWPQAWTRWISIGALLLLFIAAAIRMRDHQTTPAGMTTGVISFFLTIIVAAVLGGGAAWAASARAPTVSWVAQPGPSIAAMWLIGVATAIVCAKSLYAHTGFDGLFIGHGLCWAAIGVGATFMLPGSSYLAVVPAFVFALCMTVRATLKLPAEWAAIITAAVTAILWFPIINRLYDFMGRQTLGVTAVVVAIVSTTFTPLAAGAGWMRRATVAAMYAAAAACVILQLMIPAFTPDSPERLSIRYVDDNGDPRWEVDAAPPLLRSQAAFTRAPQAITPWLRTPPASFIAPAPRLPLAPPEVRIVSDERLGKRRLLLELHSTRAADGVGLIFHAPSLERLRIDGVAPPQRPPKFVSPLASGWHAIHVIGAQHALIEIVLKTNEPIDAIALDRSGSLPPEAAALVRARNASLGVPSGGGDMVIVQRHVRL